MNYIKVIGDTVQIGGQVASDEMIADGWVKYNNTIPQNNEFGQFKMVDGTIVVVLDEATKARRIKEFESVPEKYIYAYYNAGTQLTMTRFRQVGNETQKALVAQLDAWIDSVLIDYYTRRAAMQAAKNHLALAAISIDLSNNDATKPNIQLSTILNS